MSAEMFFQRSIQTLLNGRNVRPQTFFMFFIYTIKVLLVGYQFATAKTTYQKYSRPKSARKRSLIIQMVPNECSQNPIQNIGLNPFAKKRESPRNDSFTDRLCAVEYFIENAMTCFSSLKALIGRCMHNYDTFGQVKLVPGYTSSTHG